MAGALQKVKRDLGRNAVILNTRSFKAGGFLGFGGKHVVEITATTHSKSLPGNRWRSRMDDTVVDASDSAPPPVDRSVRNRTTPSNRSEDPRAQRDGESTQINDSLLREMSQLRSLVERMVQGTRQGKGTEVPAELFDTYTRLLQQHVAEEMVTQLLTEIRGDLTGEQLREQSIVQERLLERVAALIPEGGPILLDGPLGKAKVVALVGPTGVGKTTTVAKLAAHFKLREHKNVGLITIDTYRIAAVDQLKAYARIIDVPLEVVLSPDELKDAVARMRWMDLILIDTAGRSQNDTIRLNELKAFLDTIAPDEVHLVLSSTATPECLRSSVERFGQLGADRLIFTKLDEAVGFGVILEAIRQVNHRLSYVTMGQDVPDDIEVGSAQQLARLILGQNLSAARPKAQLSAS